jgi:hypothetical protein
MLFRQFHKILQQLQADALAFLRVKLRGEDVVAPDQNFKMSIDFLMRTDVDQEQNFRAGFRMFLFRKDNPAIVAGGTRVKSVQFPAQVMRFQTGIVDIFLHALQSGLDL